MGSANKGKSSEDTDIVLISLVNKTIYDLMGLCRCSLCNNRMVRLHCQVEECKNGSHRDDLITHLYQMSDCIEYIEYALIVGQKQYPKGKVRGY